MTGASAESARSEPTVFGAMRRYRIMVAAFMLAGVAAAIGYTLHEGKSYSGKASITVPVAQSGATVDSQVLLMESSAVAQRAASIANAALHSRSLSAQDFFNGGGTLAIFPPAGASVGTYGASIIGVTFTASSPRVAQVGANSELRAFNQELSADITAQYNSVVAGIDRSILSTTDPAQRSALEGQRDNQLVNEQIELSQRPTVVWAVEPTAAAGGSLKKTAVEGLVLGLVLGVAAAYVRAIRRRRYVEPGDAVVFSGVRLIGEVPVPQARRALRANGSAPLQLFVSAGSYSPSAEAFRFAAGAIERIRQERGPRLSLVLVAPWDSPATSVSVANLALAIAQGGTRVLAVDADDGLMSRLLLNAPAAEGDPSSPPGADNGLEAVLAGEQSLADCQRVSPFNNELAVLKPGSASARRVTGAARAKAAAALLSTAKSRYDLVLIDSPGLLQSAEGAELVGASDAAILVIGPDVLMRDNETMTDRLALIGTEAVGYIYADATASATLTRYQRGGSPGRPSGPAMNGSAPRPAADEDFPTLSFRQSIEGGNGSLSETTRG